jgi:membrane protease YdiL (CAAX protease family)
MAVVLLVLWLPAVWGGVLGLVAPRSGGRTSADYVYFLLYFAAHFALLLFIVARTKEGFVHFGFDKFRARHWGYMAATAGIATLAMLICAALLLALAPAAAHAATVFRYGRHAQAAWILLCSLPIRSAWQEVLLRGYLVTRFVDLWGSHWQAVTVAALMGGLWFLGSGAAYMAFGLATGIAFGICFLRYRSVWPVLGANVAVNVFFSAYALLHHR